MFFFPWFFPMGFSIRTWGPYLRMTNRSNRSCNPPISLQASKLLLRDPQQRLSAQAIFFWGGLGVGSFCWIGIEWNLFQRHFCWKIQEWHPFFCWILRNECAAKCFFLGQGVTMTLFLMKCELLPCYCHLPLMWITSWERFSILEAMPQTSTDLEISSYIPLN